MDEYLGLFGDDPAMQQQALAAALRRQQGMEQAAQRNAGLGGMLQAGGGKLLAPLGQQMARQAQHTQQGIGEERQGLLQLMQRQRAMAAQRAEADRDAQFRERQITETGRHNRAMEARPAAGIMPIPVYGADGTMGLLDAGRGKVRTVTKEDGTPFEGSKGTPKSPDLAKIEGDLRDRFQNQGVYKDTQTVATAYQKVMGTSETGPGDMSLIFGYMKLLDPGSTVREGEYATAANAGSVPQNIQAKYNAAVKGEKLAPEVRAQFRAEAEKVYQAQLQRYNQTADQYRRLAAEYGVKPENVILDVFGQGAAPGGSSTAKVRFQGKVLSIPRARLAEALKDGAEEVQ